jgi:hypothetical protein
MAKFHQAVPGGRIVKTSGFDEFEGITRYSWDVIDAEGNTTSGGLLLWKWARTVVYSAS